MQCPVCITETGSSSAFCPHCGSNTGTGATAQNAANSAVAALKKKGSRDAQAVPGQDTACSTDPLS